MDVDKQKLRRILIGISVFEAIPIALLVWKWLHKT